MALYRIKSGESFRDGDIVKTGGELIELDLDMAILHRNRIEAMPDVQTSAPPAPVAPDLDLDLGSAPEA